VNSWLAATSRLFIGAEVGSAQARLNAKPHPAHEALV